MEAACIQLFSYADPIFKCKYPDANNQALAAFAVSAIRSVVKTIKGWKFSGWPWKFICKVHSEEAKITFANKQWDSAYKYFNESQNLGNYLLANKVKFQAPHL